jgi:putative tryptophan/tyrosine transport system substrate-binding protein
VPRVARAALLFNPQTAPYFAFYQQPFEAAARSKGVEPIAAPVHSAADIERVFDSLGNRPDTGLVLLPDIFTTTKINLDLITSLGARSRVPTIYPYRYMVAAGGLISYGVDSADLYRRATAYIDRLLKGRQTRRSASPATDQVRTCHQPEGRQGTRHRYPRDAARPRRRGY